MSAPDSSARLRAIKTFPSLVKYLRDDLEWPIESDNFEELTFDYQPDELGLDPKTAVKIKEIKQLRPLVTGQPWGIFFLSFEPKRLPVAVLRKILGKLVVRKRASANRPEQAVWKLHDLLFISAFGESAERELTFAHFSEPQDRAFGDLPTLKVLGWNDEDTVLNLKYVEGALRDKLRWPADSDKVDAWRQQWSSAFTVQHREVIGTAKDLAARLATLATSIRKRARRVLAIESEKGELRKLHAAFHKALIHDLNEDDFADMYAQTITYGLLAARVSRPMGIVADHIKDMVPVTNPFLKEMLETFLSVGGRKGKLDFDELGIQEVVEVLNNPKTNIEALLRSMGDGKRQEDPVIYFYEDFLAAYDKKKKVERGVFYTPQPVVSYIVRSVHELLQTEFGLEDGLAATATWGEMAAKHKDLKIPEGAKAEDPFVVVLDPATGTATFLVEVINVIYKTLRVKWQRAGLTKDQQRETWNEYVPKYLLPRLFGYELMMAPYAIAHMKLGLKLYETGYRFGSGERVRVFLTNALEPAKELPKLLFDNAPALAHEAEAVNEIKRHKRFTVVIGNPPYANYSANLSPQARRIVDKYRAFHGIPIRERNQLQFERNIQDDFVKFVSIAQDIAAATSVGVMSYITNGTMLASTSLRGMRERLMQDFNSLFELNLHGGVNEIVVGGEDDENVFDIAQSVAIHVYTKSRSGGAREVQYADLIGPRLAKYEALGTQSAFMTKWRNIQPDDENSAFIPQDEACRKSIRRLDSGFVKFGAGIKTNRDAIVIGFDDDSIIEMVREFDAKLVSGKAPEKHIEKLLYRPFDLRKVFYHKDAVASRSLPTMKHMLAGPNIGLVCSSTWTTPERFSVGVSRLMVEMKTGTHDRGTTFFPLYRYESFLGSKEERVHNLSQDFVSSWTAITKTRFVPIGQGDGETTTGPEDILLWLYGLFYSPEYRRRYRAALAQRFPIVFFTGNLELFRALARLGGELVALHLLESPRLDKPVTEYLGARGPVVEKVSWSKNTVWLDKPQTTGFKGVREDVWNFHIGGYQVCEKWLKDRKGRTLSKDDIAHYHKIVVALSETIRLMAEIDKTIEKHGGWPGAFKVEEGVKGRRYSGDHKEAHSMAAEGTKPKRRGGLK